MRLLDRDPYGIETRFEYDFGSNTYGIERWQDVEKPLKLAHEWASFNDGYSPSREFKRVGSIPLVEVERLSADLGVNVLTLPPEERRKVFRRYLDENPKFKTAPAPPAYRSLTWR